MPFMIDFETSYDDDPPDMKMLNFPVPIIAYECRVFMVFAMNEPSPSNKSEPNPGDAINTEGMEVLKHTMRPDLPLTQKHEIRLPVDWFGVSPPIEGPWARALLSLRALFPEPCAANALRKTSQLDKRLN